MLKIIIYNYKISLIIFFLFTSHIINAKSIKLLFLSTEFTNNNNNNPAVTVNIIKNNNADIIVLTGVPNSLFLKKVAENAGDFKFYKIVKAEDKNQHIAIISKITPIFYKGITDLTYKIRDKNKVEHIKHLKRGFLHATYKFDNYTLNIIAAHLYERQKNPLFNHTDLRRYEARIIRKYITKIIKKNYNSNILLLANLNDDCGKSPVKDIYNRRFGIKKRLFDLRPLDSMRTSWTYFNPLSDEYERLDFAICSSTLIPEVIFNKSKIINFKPWFKAVNRRPLFIEIETIDKPLWSKSKLAQNFPNTIYEMVPGSKHFEKGKLVGKTEKRNSPNKFTKNK